MPCSIKEKQSTRCGSSRSTDLIRELILWKCENAFRLLGALEQEKSLKFRQAGSSSPYSAGRDLQFSTEDGLVSTIPNNILISQPYTDQILCQEQQKCSSANTPVWNSSSTASLGQPTHLSTQQSPRWLPKVPFFQEAVPSKHKVSTDI